MRDQAIMFARKVMKMVDSSEYPGWNELTKALRIALEEVDRQSEQIKAKDIQAMDWYRQLEVLRKIRQDDHS